VLILAAIACLGSVGLALVKAGQVGEPPKAYLIVLGVGSWCRGRRCTPIFTLRYAGSSTPGRVGRDRFNRQAAPSYVDFAYVRVHYRYEPFRSPTPILTNPRNPRTALRGTLSSPTFFGAVIIGMMINIVASLLK